MTQLTGPVLEWIREAYPNGVPDDEVAALQAVLQQRLGAERAVDVLRRLHADGLLSDSAAAALVPEEAQMRTVAARLVMAGWPLAGEEDDDSPPREGSPLARIVAWLREGYPGGVPEHDYVPLLALLERRLTRAEVKKVAKALRRADVSPAGPSEIAAAISSYTHTEPSDNDLRRVRDQLAKKGWPVEFPDPDIP
jgi:hypothetical protein